MSRRILLASLLALSSLVAFSSAQFQDLPECGVKCVNDAAPASPCASGDASCLCNNQDFINAAFNCIYSDCPNEDSSSASGNLRDTCAAVPAPSTAAPTSAAPSTTPSTTGGAPTVSGTTSSTPSSPPARPTIPTAAPTDATTTSTGATTSPPAAGGTGTRTVAGGDATTITGRSSSSSQSTVVVVQTQLADEGNILDGAGAIKAGWMVVSGVVGVVGLALSGML